MRELLFSALPKRFRSLDAARVLIRGTSVALVIQIAGNGVGYLGQILLARWLGVNGYGVYAYLFTWVQVFTIGALLGVDLGVVRFIPEFLVTKEYRLLRGILRWARLSVLATGVGLACASALVFYVFHPIRSSMATLLLGSFSIPLFALIVVQTEILRSAKRIAWAYGPPILLQPVIILAAAYGFLRMTGELTDFHAIAAWQTAQCAIVVLQGIVIHQVFSRYTRDVPAAYQTRRWLGVALPLLFYSIFAIVIPRIDTLAIGLFLGSEEVGIYSAAVKTATIIGITLAAVNTIISPMIVSHYTRRDMAGLQDVVSLATLVSFGVSLLLAAGMVVFSGPILHSFGGEFIRARASLFLLILGQLVNVGMGSVGLLMILTGYEKQSAVILGWSALIIAVLDFLVIPAFGIIGAAFVSVLGYLLWNLWIYRLAVKHLGIRASVIDVIGHLLPAKD
jgi:O-antigen/teichoic acid export membrane protein